MPLLEPAQVHNNFPQQTFVGLWVTLSCTAPPWPLKWQKITEERGPSDKADSSHSPSQTRFPLPNHLRIYAAAALLNQCFICNSNAVLEQFHT